MSAEVLLSARDLARTLDKQTLWRDISFEICRGDILFVRGPSGVGKTLLLRTLACLDPVEGGSLRLHGKSPSDVGIPCWRAQVMYVHQQRVSYPGTPLQLFERVQGFASHQARGVQPPGSAADLAQLVEQLGLDQGVLTQQWSQLSGGQAQRVSLAVSLALRPQVVLLDEPTSACDSQATLRVEAVLHQVAAHAAVVWVTHDDAQPERVGGKVLMLPAGTLSNISSTSPTLQQQEQQHGPVISSSSSKQHLAAANPQQQAAAAGGGEDNFCTAPHAAWRQEDATSDLKVVVA